MSGSMRGVVETEATAAPLRHRQTKGAGTAMPGLTPPRHTPTFMGPLRVKRVRRGDPGTIGLRDPTTIKWRRFGMRRPWQGRD